MVCRQVAIRRLFPLITVQIHLLLEVINYTNHNDLCSVWVTGKQLGGVGVGGISGVLVVIIPLLSF